MGFRIVDDTGEVEYPTDKFIPGLVRCFTLEISCGSEKRQTSPFYVRTELSEDNPVVVSVLDFACDYDWEPTGVAYFKGYYIECHSRSSDTWYLDLADVNDVENKLNK